ncbi:MAG: xanthine dehydrogenase family protein molybdopterin-binding subunit [SAR324 cluster bacterium]|jgi:isoquinoline 1-oxidoreductase beta subunit|nr:xanthine dehydrogenase family protein molybdopterin-binding subunit [SAR324 cluster bacterium]
MPNLSRRDFLRTSALAGTSLLVGCTFGSDPILSKPKAAQEQLGLWLRIAPDDSITLLLPSSEMGQGTSTSLPMVVAEELEVDLEQITLEIAPVHDAYKNSEMSMQGTVGSNSVIAWWAKLQKVGAAARTMLVQAAAQRWGVPESECVAQAGTVVHSPSGRKLRYGELVEVASKLNIPDDPALKNPKQYRYIGKPVPRMDGLAKVTGQAQFGIDITLPGMRYAVVRQSPVFGGAVQSVDDTAAKAIRGVEGVVEVPGGVAVVADSTWHAKKGADALKVEFSSGRTVGLNDAEVARQFKAALDDLGKAELGSGKILDLEYSVPFLAHATLEPMNCTADVRPDSCTLWVPTQTQQMARDKAAEVTGLDDDQVTVHTTMLGGGFGRRSETDFVAQAVTVSKAIGKPVKLVWTREEDTQHDFYRPAYATRLQIKLGADGLPERWEQQLVGPSVLSQLFERAFQSELAGNILKWIDWDLTSTEGAGEVPYTIPDHDLDYAIVDPGVPVGFWRSVGGSHTAFYIESALDEAAHLAGIDPGEYRRRLLQKQPRHLVVLEQVLQDSGWGAPLPKGHGRGLALHESFKSIVGQVLEIRVSPEGQLQPLRAWCVIDCGRVINPDTVRAQMEGGLGFGLSAALGERISLSNGRVDQSNFHDYTVARQADSPEIFVTILESGAELGGVGEPAVPPVAPALANAVFDATGIRVRSLPLRQHSLVPV